MNYNENVYKEIIKISKNDPMRLTKIALYKISCDELPHVKENIRKEVCVGAMCCRIVDIDQGIDLCNVKPSYARNVKSFWSPPIEYLLEFLLIQNL